MQFDASMQQIADNEANRQYWDADQLNRNQVDYGRAMDQKSLLETGTNMLMDQDAANEQNRQYWAKNNQELAQQNEQNRQYWSEFLNTQNMYDQTQQVQDWTRNLDMMKWLTGREDDLINRQQGNYVDQQTTDYGILQDGINNIMSFISGQGPAASAMNANYWTAYNNQAQQNKDNQALNQQMANTASGAALDIWKQFQNNGSNRNRTI
jgi:hypothetical protein